MNCIKVMERLHSAIDTLLDETCEGLMRPNHVRTVAKKCGLRLNKEEAEKLTQDMLHIFRAKFRERTAELIQDAKIEQKLSNLKVLAEKCKRQNEELQITDGYRSLGPKADMEGVMHPVASAYHSSLSLLAAKFKEDIKIASESLRQAKEQVQALAMVAESVMDKKEASP